MPTSQCRICTKRCREFKIQVTPQLTPAQQRHLPTCSKPFRIIYGGEWGPVTFPAFKAGDSSLRGWNGGFDFHTPPPSSLNRNYLARRGLQFTCWTPKLPGPATDPASSFFASVWTLPIK